MMRAEDEPFLILRSIGARLRIRIGLIAGVAMVGFLIGYPVAGEILERLLSSSFLPEDASIVVLHPMEVILLRLRIASYVGLALALLVFSIDLLRMGGNSDLFEDTLPDLSQSIQPHLGATLLVILCSLGLAGMGLLYSFEFVVPLLLQYLSADASSFGLSTTWQLEAWAGFILSLVGASVLVFQTPMLVFSLLRSGTISRQGVTSRRREIWFSTAVFSMLVSPPDPLSLLLIALPVVLLMEGTLLLDSVLGRPYLQR
ncbi:MAG: twin-arginine translocase subunit TatC [Candidatus Thermoplasmatota archaeon]|nr:twin-arginine translocase subunit TatC [Candidatus Thermoplasmatota archaeon]|tara:strand:+ start:362 stop:1135 length:774 start_codon:yes stop_codon:yes gene_type:complete